MNIDEELDMYDPANGVTMQCEDCGSTWPDDGRGECPICGSVDFDKAEEDIADDSDFFEDSD